MELFLFDKKNQVYIHPEAVKLTEHIKKLSPKETLYVILAHSYQSKFHMFPLDDRKRRAKREVFPGYGEEDIETTNDLLKAASEEFCDLQYDVSRETLRVYINKIAELQKRLIAESDHSKIIQIDKSIIVLEKRLDIINDKIYKADQAEIKLKGKKTQSFIEKWQRNMVEQKKAREETLLRSGIEYLQ